ncbi:MAG TPA: GH116 family glycosyl hydrolase [Terriglobia bacterium]|nr:GH116 family glycosyl hydrolase [Terriglobia bacterium]
MKQRWILRVRGYSLALGVLCALGACEAIAQIPPPAGLPKFVLSKSGLELMRRTQAGSFFDVVGRKSAIFGYENRPLEAWVYPLKILNDFNLAFRLEGYPLDIPGREVQVSITARPEATVFTYSHAAFTVRQIIFAPIEEPGIVMLLGVQSVLPMTITGSFRPQLKLEWPAGLMTPNVDWDEREHAYFLTEETRRFVGMIGSPAAEDIALMPYQEEPRDVPVRFVVKAPLETAKTEFIPIIIAGSVNGRNQAKATYEKLLHRAQQLYENNVRYYERLQNETVNVVTPDERLNTAFAWAKVGVDKGIATNPFLGTGVLAGFRTSGDSERPGFAWFFGRDALWTSLAITSYGDFAATREALDFLKKFQRADGKIPHEISQSASLVHWFTDYPYPWASADATPLYVIAHADYWRASGDLDFIRANWESIVRAYRFSAATDRDGNGLIENTNVGHGWVEGGALYPAHEEIYLEGLWIEASLGIVELAEQMKDSTLAAEARTNAERTRSAVEKTYWLPDRGFYAFATALPRSTPAVAEPGPNRAARQARLNELSKAHLIDEDTVLPAVPLWWHELEDGRAQSEIDHFGDAHLATDWGLRIISDKSLLYDPLAYHYGSVWPLFTGWAGVAAYTYSRPHVGFQALMANASLTFANALGYVTELLSGDFDAPFGRSSHHQVWSEAMVAAATLRGLLGLEVSDGGRTLRFAPQLPADWDRVSVSNVRAGGARYDLALTRMRFSSDGLVKEHISVVRREDGETGADSGGRLNRLIITPAWPLDAKIKSVTVNGRAAKFDLIRAGDAEQVQVVIENPVAKTEVALTGTGGTDVYVDPEALQPGATSEGVRILHSRADDSALRLTLEGLGGREYVLSIRSGRRIGEPAGGRLRRAVGQDPQLRVTFNGPIGVYVRQELTIPLSDQEK